MSLFGSHKSNSLFGSGDSSKKVSPPHKFDWGAAAMSFLGVDPNLFIGRRRQQAAMAAEQQVRDGLKARGYSDSDINVLMADPKQASALIQQVLQPHQFGPGGGSITTGPNNDQFIMAPSRHEYQGSVFDVGGGAPGQQATVTPQHEGTQWVTPQPGTQPIPVNSFSGGVRRGGEFNSASSAPPTTFKPGQTFTTASGKVLRFKGGDDTDPANWEDAGGAVRSGPPTFP